MTFSDPTTREELLIQVDRGWVDLERRVRRLPIDAYERPTATGWSLKAMLAHIAAWHDATTHRLYRFLATGREQPMVVEDDDAFNATVVEETADRSAEQVRRSLYRSFERLREVLGEVPPDLDGSGWIAAVAAGNSYGHYPEHLPELDAALEPSEASTADAPSPSGSA